MGTQILRTVVAAAVAATQTFSQSPRVTRSDPVLVTAVLDGDTITVSTFGRVRLLGIDAPEISHGLDTAAPFGREARERLTGLVLHRWIRLEMEGPALDAYNRRLAYAMIEDGRCVNAIMVREGLARVSARLPLSRLEELKRAEADAQAFRRGIWGGTPQIPTPSYTRRSGAKRPSASKHSSTKRARKKKKP